MPSQVHPVHAVQPQVDDAPGGPREIRRILLVDDEPGIRTAYGTVLRENGYDVEVACDGRQALRMLGKSPVDLVICDIVMPDCDGLETLTVMRRRFPGVAMISISGGGTIAARDYLDMAMRLGAQATLAKPFSALELLTTISELGPSGAGLEPGMS